MKLEIDVMLVESNKTWQFCIFKSTINNEVVIVPNFEAGTILYPLTGPEINYSSKSRQKMQTLLR
jgi:hypothetical protein